MNKDREVVYSRKSKAESEHHLPKSGKAKHCKKVHCEGVEKENATSRFHSEGKSQKPTKRKLARQKSDSKLPPVKVVEELTQLRNQYQTLHLKYESKRKQLSQLKSTLKNYQDQINHQDRLIRSFSKKSTSQPNKNILGEAQILTREAIDKYRILSDQFNLYKQQAALELESQKAKHEKAIIKLKENYESKMNKLESSSSREVKQKEVFRTRQQQALQQTDIKIYKEEIKRLKVEKQQLLGQLEQEQEGFRVKEEEFKLNLRKITQKVQNWGSEAGRVQDYQQAYQQLQNEYALLEQKYLRSKSRQKQKTREWGIIFQEFLTQINKLKRQLQILPLNSRLQKSFQ